MTNDEYQALLKDSEMRLDRLRSLYEQWFQGIERREPKEQREEMDRRVALFRRNPVRNTALRFRTQTLIQRYVSLHTYWRRVSREIEEGTNFRTIQRARRRSKARDAATAERTSPAAAQPFDLDFGDIEDLDALVAELREQPSSEKGRAEPPRPTSGPPPPLARPKPTPPMPPPPPKPATPPPLPSARARAAPPATTIDRPPAPEGRFALPKAARPAATNAEPAKPPIRREPSPPAAGPTDERIRDIYDRYVDARRKNNERIDNVRLESLSASIKKMVPSLEQKHRGKKIDFEIVVKDGRVGLKPVPKD
jgi:hypothetical protein